VHLNETELGKIAFGGQAQGKASFFLPTGLIKPGANQVTLTAEAGVSDVSLVDYIRLTYSHSTTADNNRLKLTAIAEQHITIYGFTSDQIRLVDVTDHAAVQEITGSISKCDDRFALSVTVPGGGQSTLLAFTDDQTKRPEAITANAPSNWRKTNGGADLIIIHHGMSAAVAPLIAARQRQGLSVDVVDVEDIFDEFSFGEKSPQAIKAFLVFAETTWKKKPQYLLIVGDASYDPKNYLGFGDIDLVPTRLIDTNYMEAASDDWFADFDNDGVPELAVGRLPAKTEQDAAAMISRLVAYEDSSPANEAVLVADLNDGFNFEDANVSLKRLLPANIKAVEIKRGELGESARPELIAAINRGQCIVNYTGHGSVDQWHGSLLTNGDASTLTNQEHLSLFVMMTCLNGYFADPAIDSLAEALMKAPRGGAIAAWASSAMTLPNAQTVVNQELFRQLFNNRLIRIGMAVRAAKRSITDHEVRQTWILLGDPTMRLKR